MSITQVGVATISDELLAYIKEQIKSGTIEWSDLIDTPEYAGQDGKFLKASSSGGSASMAWEDLPASGLNWVVQETDTTSLDKIGFLASGGITITLPENPEEGNLIAVSDHLSEFDINPVTIVSTDNFINGEDNLILDLRNAYVQLIFDGDEWVLSQVNHPFNIQEISEETFSGGTNVFNLARIPANRTSILVTVNGTVVPTSQYSVLGNVMTFGTSPVGTVTVRHIGVPNINAVSDVPVGAMLYFPKGTDVDGWSDCDGGSVHRSVYPDLVSYLTGDDNAEIGYKPDARGNFIRTWDMGNGTDTIGVTTIPSVLINNEWGRWLDTTYDPTAANLWDGNVNTITKVKVAQGYVGYNFDVPVRVNSVDIGSKDPIGGVHLPTVMQLKASNDGITWVAVSELNSGPFQNRTVNITSTTSTPYKYWGVFGTGGTPYTGDSEYYWGVGLLSFNASTESRRVGGFQTQSVGELEPSLASQSAGAGSVQSGSGATALVAGSTGTVSGGTETRPNNQAYVLKIKAFHYQSGSMAASSVTALRSEVSRLSSQVNDGTSYSQNFAPLNPSENARWFDTSSGRTYLWFNDGDSYQWVDDSPQSSATTRESLNASLILSTGSREPRQINDRFADITNVLDFGAFRNSTDDSKRAFELAGAGPVFIPTGAYVVSGGDFTGNLYFSFGPVVISGSSTGIIVKDLLA